MPMKVLSRRSIVMQDMRRQQELQRRDMELSKCLHSLCPSIFEALVALSAAKQEALQQERRPPHRRTPLCTWSGACSPPFRRLASGVSQMI